MKTHIGKGCEVNTARQVEFNSSTDQSVWESFCPREVHLEKTEGTTLGPDEMAWWRREQSSPLILFCIRDPGFQKKWLRISVRGRHISRAARA
jgi:hypothetical protein